MQQIAFIVFMITIFNNLTLQQNFESDHMIYEEDELFFANQGQSLFFDSNEPDITKITTIEYKFIEQAFSIELPYSSRQINFIMLNSVKFQNLKQYCVCQLLQTRQHYFIVCNDGVLINKKNKSLDYQKEAKKYQIDLMTDIEESCQDLYANSENEILTICSSSKKLKIVKINLSEQQSTIVEIPLEFDLNKCSQKMFNLNQLLLFVLYNCDDWIIFDVTTQEIKIFFDKKLLFLLDSENEINIQYLTGIFICQNKFYLIEFTNYYIVLHKESQFIYDSKNREENEIKIITFSKYCFIEVMILHTGQQANKAIQFSPQNRIFLNNDIQDELHLTNQFLFLRKNNQLNLILCQFLNQTYQILSSKMYFLDQYQIGDSSLNLFFQIDEIQKKVIFYEYQNLPKILKLEKNYLHQILSFCLFSDFADSVPPIRILYSKKLMNEIQSFNQIFQNDCSQPLQSHFNKRQPGLPQNYELLYLKQLDSIDIRMIDEENFQIADIADEEIEAVYWIGQLGITQFDYKLYLTKENKIIYSLKETKKKQIYQFIREESQVFNFLSYIAIVNYKKNQIIMPLLVKGDLILNEVNFDKKIMGVTQCQHNLIISFIDKSYLIFNILIQQYMYKNEQFIQFGIPQSFYAYLTHSFLQYQQLLIYQNNKQIHIMEFEDATIYSIYYEKFGSFIKAIHNIEDKIITYCYNGALLVKMNEFKITKSKFIRPIVLSQSGKYEAIASITNSQKSIIILRVSSSISIVKIKLCSNYNFTLHDEILLYFDQVGKLKLLYLSYYRITIQNMTFQTDYINKYQKTLLIKYQVQNQTVSVQKKLNFIVYNKCDKLFKKQNTLEISNAPNILNLEQLFYGPIKNISSNDENQTIVTGPLQIIETLKECNNKSIIENQCIIQYEVIFKSTKPYFNFKCIQSLLFCELFQTNFNLQTKVIKQEFISNYKIQCNIIKYENQNFIHLFEMDDQNLKLIEISLQQLIELPKDLNLLNAKISIRNLLILITLGTEQILLYIKENKHEKYHIENHIVDFKVAKNQNDLFFLFEFFYAKKRELNFFCEIVSFKNDERTIHKSLILGNDLVEFVTSQKQHINIFQLEIQLVNWEFYQTYIEFNLFIIFSQFSNEVNIIYNFETGEQQFKIVKNLKNPIQETNLWLSFYDNNYSIISSSAHYYIYNLTHNQSIYNYIAQLNQSNIKLFYSNTYFILKNSLNFQIIEFAYQLQVKKSDDQKKRKNFLVVQNYVSSEELEVIIKESNNENIKQEQGKNFKFYVLTLIIILVVVLLIRRFKIKHRINKNNQIQELCQKEIK